MTTRTVWSATLALALALSTSGVPGSFAPVPGVAAEPSWAAPPAGWTGAAPKTPPKLPPPPAEQMALLSKVIEKVKAAASDGTSPVAIFDLDSTIFDTGPRHFMILEEYARSIEKTEPELAKRMRGLKPEEMTYGVDELLAKADISDPATVKAYKAFWGARFFTNEYVQGDPPYPGAIDFVNELRRAGATIVYLTGRDEPNMGEGSRTALKNGGFPLNERGVLMLKPSKEIKDDVFKQEATVTIRKMGCVVASFDNEPKNINILRASFPDSIAVFFDTIKSPNAVPVDPGIPYIKDFRWK